MSEDEEDLEGIDDNEDEENVVVLPTFPEPNSIPPATFYTIQGLASWLNQNASYKGYFINYPNQFPYLYAMTSSLSSIGYNVQNVPLSPFVTTLSQTQSRQYTDQLTLFRKVYAYNSNAYVAYVSTGVSPIYYRFQTYQELMNYKASVPLVNKLYPFDAMAYGTNESGSTLGWIVPFPL